MSYHFLLTSIPELPSSVVLDQKLDTQVKNILDFINENQDRQKYDVLYYINLSEDLKNIFAKLQGVSFVFSPFTLLREEILNKNFEEMIESDDFPYLNFFENINFKDDVLKLEWKLFNKFIDTVKNNIFKDYFLFDSAIKYMFETEDIDKKEYFVDLFDSQFNKTYLLAKELFNSMENINPVDKELYIANLKLAYISELEKNKSFTKINLEAYLLKLLIHNRFTSLNEEVSKKNIEEFINFKLEF